MSNATLSARAAALKNTDHALHDDECMSDDEGRDDVRDDGVMCSLSGTKHGDLSCCENCAFDFCTACHGLDPATRDRQGVWGSFKHAVNAVQLTGVFRGLGMCPTCLI